MGEVHDQHHTDRADDRHLDTSGSKPKDSLDPSMRLITSAWMPTPSP